MRHHMGTVLNHLYDDYQTFYLSFARSPLYSVMIQPIKLHTTPYILSMDTHSGN